MPRPRRLEPVPEALERQALHQRGRQEGSMQFQTFPRAQGLDCFQNERQRFVTAGDESPNI